MSGNITTPTPSGPSIRAAAEAAYSAYGNMNFTPDSLEDAERTAAAMKDLREALAQPEVSRADLLERAHWAEEGIKLMREQQPVLPIHIQSIVEAAEAGLQAHRSFGVRWGADMRAIARWRSATPSRDIVELIEAGKAVVAADERATAELAEIGISADQQGLAVQLSQRLKGAIDDVLAYSIEAAVPEQREIMLPDHADLVVWLLGLLDRSVDRSVEGISLDAVDQLATRLARAGMWHASQGSAHGDSIVGGEVAGVIRELARLLIAADRRAFLAEQRAIPADLEARIADVLAGELGDSYDCGRVWEAWSIGTMSEDDFEPLSERVDDIAAALAARIAPFSILGGAPAEASGSGQEPEWPNVGDSVSIDLDGERYTGTVQAGGTIKIEEA